MYDLGDAKKRFWSPTVTETNHSWSKGRRHYLPSEVLSICSPQRILTMICKEPNVHDDDTPGYQEDYQFHLACLPFMSS